MDTPANNILMGNGDLEATGDWWAIVLNEEGQLWRGEL